MIAKSSSSPPRPLSTSTLPRPPDDGYYFRVANELLGGKSVSELDPADISRTLLSLSLLRRDAVSAGHSRGAEHIEKLIATLHGATVPPLTPTVSPPSRRSTTSPRKTLRDSPSQESVSEAEDKQFSGLIDELLNGKQIVFDQTISRQKLLRVIARRSERALNRRDYRTVEDLGSLYQRVEQSSPASDSRDVRTIDPIARRAALVQRLEGLKQEKEARLKETRAAFADRDSKLEEDAADSADRDSRLDEDGADSTSSPGKGGKKPRHWSKALIDLQRAAASHARAGEYDTAIALRRQADAAEASEKRAHKASQDKDSERRKAQEEARRERANRAREAWRMEREIATSQSLDLQIDTLTKMIQAVDRDLEVRRRGNEDRAPRQATTPGPVNK
jgi:hypothetical protein